MPPSASEPVTPHNQSLIFSDGEWISHGEFALRRRLCFGFRLALATFCSAQLWEFMFNPIWMHGYLWSLNQQYSIVDPSTGGSLADKSAVAILEHQLALTGHWERAGHAVLSALASWLLLHCAGFGRADRTVWRLLWLSICFGAVAGLTRTVQQQQRLYPCVHECFFGCLLLFLNGLCLCLRLPSAIKEKTLELEDEVDEKRREKCE